MNNQFDERGDWIVRAYRISNLVQICLPTVLLCTILGACASHILGVDWWIGGAFALIVIVAIAVFAFWERKGKP